MPKNTKKPTRRADGRFRKIVNGITFYAYSERELNRKILDYHEKKERGPLFKEVADAWWDEACESLAAQSIKVYKPALARALNEFGDMRIKEIEPRDISAFFRTLARQQFGHKTILNQKLVINQIFNQAVLDGDLTYNPCTAIRLPKNLKQSYRDPATEEEESIILNSDHPWIFPFFSLLTGLRKGEILALQWKDINFDERIIYITKSVEHIGNRPNIKSPKTAAGMRIVPLVDILADRLLPVVSDPDSFIFSDDNGKTPLTNKRYHTLYHKYCDDVGISASSHQIRHSYATIAVEEDIGIKDLQNALGHASSKMTLDVYAKSRRRSVQKVADKLNAKYNTLHVSDKK